MGVDLEQITLKFNASIGNVSKTFDALEKRLSKLQTSLSGLNTANLDRLASCVDKLSGAMGNMASSAGAEKAMRSLATSLDRLAKVDTASVARASSVLSSMGNALRTLPTIDPMQSQSLSELATAMNAFGRVKSVNGIAGLGTLSTNIRELMTSLDGFDPSRFQQLSSALESFASALNILGRAKVSQAITNLPLLAKEMENLMQSLARAPTVSDNLIRMTEALAKLSAQGGKVGTATNGLNRALNSTSYAGRNGARGLNLFGNSARGAHKHVKSLASTVGGLIAKYWILWRAIQGLGNMAGVASNLVEVQNVVDHTFGQMQSKLDDFTKSSIENFGLGELAAKQYASRFQSMGMSMGITNSQVAKTSDFVSAHMSDEAKAIYNTSDSLADMSINLTKLAADYASFYDVDPSEAFEKMQSVLTGQTRPLRAYGLDLTQATLKEWALKNGIDADISSMTQAEKAMLRYQYVMAQSSHITGDFARTSETYHNVLTKLKANFMTLKGTIGTSLMNLFKPVLVVVNNAIVVINRFAKAIGDSLGKILGWRYEVGSGAVELDDTAGYMDDVADSAGGAGKAIKDLKKQLQGFDELNNLTTNDDNGGGGGSGGSGGIGAGGASDLAGQWVKEDSLFESDWDTWFKLGRGISEAWTEGLNSIDWDSVYSAFDNFGTGLANFLNGLITPELFGAVGRTIAGSLNSAFHFLDSFGETFDWKNFGNSIATGINGFFTTFDFKLAADTINVWSKGILDTAISAVEGVDWEKVGTSITTFFSNLELGEIAKKLSKLALSIVNGLSTALSTTDWTMVGKKIGEMLNGLDLTRIAVNLVNLAFKILEALGKALIGLGEENPLAAAIITVILGIKFANKLGDIGNTLLKAMGLSVGNATDASLGTSLFNKINNLTTKYFGANTLTVAASVAVAWKLGESIGKQLGNELWTAITGEDMSEYFENFTWSNFFSELISAGEDNVLLDAWNNMWSDFMEHIADWLSPVSEKIKSVLRSMPGGQYIADFLQIDISTTKEEMQEVVDTYNKLYEETGYAFYKNAADEAQKKLDTEYGSSTHTSSSGVEHGGSSGKFGSNSSGFFATFDVAIPEETEEKVTTVWNKLVSIWKDDEADYTIDSEETSPSKIEKDYNTRKFKWTDLKSLFTIGSGETPIKTVSDDYSARSTYWRDIKSKFTIDPKATTIKSVNEASNDRKKRWTSKTVDYKVSPYATSTDTIKTARDARHNIWTGKTSNFSVNTNATSINAVITANSAYQAQWKDKVASYAISFGVDASKVNSFINSNVFAKINNVFAKIPILKGFNIPYLATGGITDKATLAMFGEDGAEAVVPLEKNTQWLGKMANMLATELEYNEYSPSSTSYNGATHASAYTSGTNANDAQIAEQNALLREQNRLLQQIAQKELTISEREVFNATRNASNNYYNRTGNSPFVF